MSEKRPPADPLTPYVEATGKSDAAIGRLIGVSRWVISRGRRGESQFSMENQLALEEFTGVTPSQWAEYYAKLVTARSAQQGRTYKKSLAVAGDAA